MRILIAVAFVISFGWSAGHAQQLISPQEVAAVQKKISQVWNPPKAGKNRQPVTIILKLNKDGTLSAPPEVVVKDPPPGFEAFRDSALKAVHRAAPYTMLRQESYESWKEIELVLEPRFHSEADRLSKQR